MILKKTVSRRLLLLIFLALAISLTFGIQHYIIAIKIKPCCYSPIIVNNQTHNLTVDETFAYAPKIQSLLKNHLKLSPFQLYESRNLSSPFISENLPALIMAGLTKISGNISIAFIAADFIFPPIIFLLFFYLLFLLTKNFLLSVSGSLINLTCQKALGDFPFIRNYLLSLLQYPFDGKHTLFTRNFHPQISYIFLLLALITFYQLLKKKDVIKIISFGVSFGLLFYSYFFYLSWFALGAIIVILLTISKIKKKKE